NPLPWCDGRCVQGPGTYSPRHSDSRLLAIPTSRSRVADCDPDYDRPGRKGHDDLTSSPPSSGLSPAVSLECPPLRAGN
ncbi:unnamed protein product, partial [Onchocerca ochengi]